MSKKFNKIMSVVLALMMVCSLLPMGAMAAENVEYTVTFEPGSLCAFVPDTSVENPDYNYVTRTYDGSGTFNLPTPAEARIFPLNEDRMTFAGWVVKGTTEPVYNAGDNVASVITGDITFVANYVENVIPDTVTYYIEPGEIASMDNQTVSRGPIPTQYLTETSLPTTDEGIHNEFGWTIPDDKTFDHWQDSTGATLTDAGNGRTNDFTPANGAHYIAYWSAKAAATYTVTLHPGTIGTTDVEGEPIVDGTFTSGATYKGPADVPYKAEGYHITGWSYSNGEVVRFPITITGNVDLYAVWASDATQETWTVTINAGEGASFRTDLSGYTYVNGALVANVPVDSGEYNFELPGAFDINADGENALFATMPAGMEFAGWILNDSEIVYYSGQLVTVDANTTFTAKWRAEGEGPYNIIFNAGIMADFNFRGTQYVNRPSSMEAAAGSTYNLPSTKSAVLSAFGWNVPAEVEFAGWVNLNDADTPITSVEGIDSDVTVVALWITPNPFTFTVTFDAGGGEGYMAPDIHTTFDTTYDYTVPECTFTPPVGMTFLAWTDADFSDLYAPGQIIKLTASAEGTSLTLVALWTEASSPNFTNG